MENIIIYNLKVAFILTVFWVMYSLLFSREKYFTINRIYLISTLLISFLLPLLKFESISENSFQISLYEEKAREIIVYSSSNISQNNYEYPIILIAYLIGVVFFLILFVIRFISVLNIIGKANFINKNKYSIYFDNNSANSYTFFNKILIGTKNINPKDSAIIEMHEKIHVEKKHTIDILIFEIAKILQWFNPVIYFLSKNIVVNHEFIADELVRNNYSSKEYMELMAKSLIGAPLYPVNSFFNKSIIRKRFDMLTIEKNNNSKLKYLNVIPVLLLLTIFISCKNDNKVFENALDIQQIANDSEKMGKDNIGAQFPGGIYNYTENNLETPEGADNINAKLHYKVVIDESGKLIAAKYKNAKFLNSSDKFSYLGKFKKSAKEMLLNMPNWDPAKKDGIPVKFTTTVGVVFGGIKNWKDLNPPDMVAKTSENGDILTERTEKDFSEVEHLYFNDLMMHITKNIQYPEAAHKKGIAAKVMIEITLDKEGNIQKSQLANIQFSGNLESSDIDLKKLETDISKGNKEAKDPFGFIEESLKIINSAGKLTPAKDKNGNPVSITVMLPVTFKLK